ncbi:hypothetical protein BDV25DRAFT_162708 [Aspergillus avenaceus]|uniref:Protein kinase domain-containing protein n=1 Tax=Aspergillus avenaceus TaxID=36643 RepID=A0A5N6TJ20_ASPAV|nr:hypothetical protein BDV25DRAFT_162708 [Aspergillus avenaceus]
MTCFFKPADIPEHTNRETSTLLRIQKLGLSNILRAPKIHGFVEFQRASSRISGILLEYIEHCNTLGHINIPTTPLPVRVKWINQLRNTIKMLHSAGIIWGDAKPDNILVDADENLWIIDFGGGYTHGWVDEDKESTIDGDNQALFKIVDFLLDEAQNSVPHSVG